MGLGPYCAHGDLLNTRTMTQRSERWLIVGACVVLYVLAMGLLIWAIRDPVNWLGAAIFARFGGWGIFVIFAPLASLLAWTTWRDRHVPPVEFKPPKWPRWVRIIGSAYLALLGAGLVIGLAAMVFAG